MNYYNEFDHNAAEWLRELIAEGLIPPGDVDERSITDVRADELLGYTQCHFFAGIGGWSLALRLIGWPDDKPVWTGSCPCQSFSTAGKQRGFDDDRDLWPVFAKLIAKCRPEYVFGEQVENAIRHGWLDRVYADLEGEGYTVGAAVLGAHSVGAPHKRQRLYWGAVSVAENADGWGCGGRSDGDQTGCGREIQATGLRADGGMAYGSVNGCDGRNQDAGRSLVGGECRRLRESARTGDVCGMDDPEILGRGICNAAHIGKTDGEINAFADASCGGCGVAHVQGDGWDERGPESDGRSASAGCGNIGIPGEHRERVEDRGSGGVCRLADNNGKRQQEQCGDIAVEQNEQREASPIGAELRSLSGLPPWSNSRFIYCRDGKVRRIPAESLLFGVADGLPEEVDGSWIAGISEVGGFPLTTQKEGRVMLLKGYGNAINPYCATAFIKGFMEVLDEKSL